MREVAAAETNGNEEQVKWAWQDRGVKTESTGRSGWWHKGATTYEPTGAKQQWKEAENNSNLETQEKTRQTETHLKS